MPGFQSLGKSYIVAALVRARSRYGLAYAAERPRGLKSVVQWVRAEKLGYAAERAFALARSTRASKASGSAMAISLSILRFRSIVARFSP